MKPNRQQQVTEDLEDGELAHGTNRASLGAVGKRDAIAD
jgi:hypothetical protein